MTGYRTPFVAALLGVTCRQLHYWRGTGLVRPSLADGDGSGSILEYSADDVVVLAVVKALLDHGVSLQALRTVVAPIREAVAADEGRQMWLVVAPGRCLVTARLDDAADVDAPAITVLDLRRLADDVRRDLAGRATTPREEGRCGLPDEV